MKYLWLTLLLSTAAIYQAAAQEPAYDPEAFIKGLNERLAQEQLQGVQVVPGEANVFLDFGSGDSDLGMTNWAKALTAKTPQNGFVVFDQAKRPVDVLGPDLQYTVKADNSVNIVGYDPPPGGEVKLVGPAEWNSSVQAIAAANDYKPSPPSNDIQRALTVVRDATDYVASMMCTLKSRPTKLTLNLTAGFELAFNIETGSEVEWDLEVVCKRYAEASTP